MQSRNIIKATAALKAARELLTNAEHWTKESSARKADGTACHVMNENAKCWCALGALERSGANTYYIHRALDKLRINNTISAYNDHAKTTHDDVLKMFDVAIELSESAEPGYV